MYVLLYRSELGKGHDRELKDLSAIAIRNRAKFDHFSIGISIGDISIDI